MIERVILINILVIPLILIFCKYIGVEDKFKEYKDNSDIK